MKKFFATVALVAAMFTVNVTEVNAQSTLDGSDYKAVNHRIHEVHVKDYLNKGDDEYRLGHYDEAMKAYKSAREHNNIDENIVPNSVIDQKMDRCADAMRRDKNKDDRRDNGRSWRDNGNTRCDNGNTRRANVETVLDAIFNW